MFRPILTTILIILLTTISPSAIQADAPDQSQLIAFPGAMGGGKYTTGGRGGKVVKVTNLNDSGPGSLRAAVGLREPRIIVFDVSGTIELQRPLHINHGNVTIAGQSAPGDGICIKAHQFKISADNVIIRYMRFRPGDVAEQEYDAITAINRKNIIIDHCSMSWSTDEAGSFYDNENFTLQWCLLAESLNKSAHSKGEHGYGGIWGGTNATFVFNILAHHKSRNPRLQGARDQQDENVERTEMINNIIYNWASKAIYGGEKGRYNIVGNIFIPGPATTSNRDEILEPYEPLGTFYLNDNIIYEDNTFKEAGWDYVSLPDDNTIKPEAAAPFELANAVNPLAPLQVYDMLLEGAGASFSRDSTDQRIIDEIRNRKYTYGNSGIIDSQEQTGGWPVLNSLPAKTDSDSDGMPDNWERQNNLNPNDSADNNKKTLDEHYSNIEVYLNSLIK